MPRLCVDGGEVLRVLNEVDLEVGASRPPRAGCVDSDFVKGAINECIEDLFVTWSLMLVNENDGKVLCVCADSLPGDGIGARRGPIDRLVGSDDLVS